MYAVNWLKIWLGPMLYPLFFNEALRSACAPVYFNVSDFLTAANAIHNLRPGEAESFRGAHYFGHCR